MPDTLIFEKNPHMRGTRKTSLMMLEFFIVVLILYVASVLFYFIKGGPSDDYSKTMYGLMALQNGLVGVGFAVIADLIWYFPYVFRKEGVEGYISKVLHSYSYVSGLILVLLLPIGPEWWEIALTSFVAVFFTKLIFGGFGSNIMNPAIFGRIFAQVCFSNHLTTYLGDIVPEGNSTLISAGATIPVPWTVIAFRFLAPQTAPKPPLANTQSFPVVMDAIRTRFSPAGPMTRLRNSCP